MRKSGMLHVVAVISVMGQRQENPSSSVASQSSKIEDFQFSERSYLKRIMQRATDEDSPASACACVGTCVHEHTPLHPQAHKMI